MLGVFGPRAIIISVGLRHIPFLLAEHQYPVKLVKCPGNKTSSGSGSGAASSVSAGPVLLLVHGLRLCLTTGSPPRVLYSWSVPDLRRFGAVDKKFVIEAGSRSGKSE